MTPRRADLRSHPLREWPGLIFTDQLEKHLTALGSWTKETAARERQCLSGLGRPKLHTRAMSAAPAAAWGGRTKSCKRLMPRRCSEPHDATRRYWDQPRGARVSRGTGRGTWRRERLSSTTYWVANWGLSCRYGPCHGLHLQTGLRGIHRRRQTWSPVLCDGLLSRYRGIPDIQRLGSSS